MPRATLALQVLPLNAPDALAAVDAAIDVIRDSGVSHEVGPMETTIEGDSLARAARHCRAGARRGGDR